MMTTAGVSDSMSHSTENPVHIPVDDVELEGILEVPDRAGGLVVFAHGNGSSRESSRNNSVAEVIRRKFWSRGEKRIPEWMTPFCGIFPGLFSS